MHQVQLGGILGWRGKARVPGKDRCITARVWVGSNQCSSHLQSLYEILSTEVFYSSQLAESSLEYSRHDINLCIPPSQFSRNEGWSSFAAVAAAKWRCCRAKQRTGLHPCAKDAFCNSEARTKTSLAPTLTIASANRPSCRFHLHLACTVVPQATSAISKTSSINGTDRAAKRQSASRQETWHSSTSDQDGKSARGLP